MMNTTRSSVAAIAALLLLGCSGKSGDESDVATKTGDGTSMSPGTTRTDSAHASNASQIRFVNALSQPAAVDVLADSAVVFSSVAFMSVTPYQPVTDNVVTFRLRAQGVNAELAANREMMRDGGRYTMIAMPDREGGARVRIVRDDLKPADGKARVRLFHAVPGLDDVDVRAQGQKDALFDDVDYGSEAGFTDVAPGRATLSVTAGSANRRVASIRPMDLKAGNAYTVVLAGRAGGSVSSFSFIDSLLTAGSMRDSLRADARGAGMVRP